MFDLETPALILKFGRFPLHHGTLGIIRSLGSVGIPVYAALEDLWVPAGWSRYLAGKFVWNPDENADPELLAGLTEIGERDLDLHPAMLGLGKREQVVDRRQVTGGPRQSDDHDDHRRGGHHAHRDRWPVA